MEFSKDSNIIITLDNLLELLTDNNTLVINLNNKDYKWSELEFNNFVSSVSKYYNEVIDDYILEIKDENNNTFEVNSMANIIKFCNNEKYQSINNVKWYNNKILYFKDVNDLFDCNINFNINENITLKTEPDNWLINKKKYSIHKKIKYVDSEYGIDYIVKLIKKHDNNEVFETLKDANIIKNAQEYEFSIVIHNNIKKELIIQSIIKMLQYITLYPNIILKDKEKEILEEYHTLIKPDIRINNYNKKKIIPLLTPKPITLDRNNLVDPMEYGAISILDGYTVTEKADGERLLLYINGNGNMYTINNTYNVVDTGLIADSNLYNSLIDGEYVICNKRTDESSKNIYAAFDMYYIKGRNITSLPLIAEGENNSRYAYLNYAKKYIKNNNSTIEFIVKKFYYNDDILKHCNKILTDYKSYPYEIDGLIFTPMKLPLYSYYSNKPVQLTDNVRWDRLFKWKPPEQNTIDFLVKFGKIIKENGQKFREIKLYVGYNSNQWEEIGPNKGLRLRYDYKYAKEQKYNLNSYRPTLFKPTVYYSHGVETAYIKINSKGELRAEDNSIIEENSIVEFSYTLNDKIKINYRWSALRVREDKTRLFRKGEISKTMNDLNIAINIWRSIHNSVSLAMIMGNDKKLLINDNNKILESDDVYYSRNIPRESLLSLYMLNFHNQCIKKKLYEYSKDRNSLLELCGGEGGDLNRWLEYSYKFILSIDLVKQNIYNPRSGGYSRLIKKKNQIKYSNNGEKIYFPDIVFAVGDCAVPINTGEAAKVVNDSESENILKIVMNKNRNTDYHLRYISGKGSDKFSVCSCQFAIHYFFKDEENLNGFFSNVSTNLKRGGIFFATFMDGNKVMKEIENSKTNIIEGKKLITDDTYVRTWAIIKRYDETNDNKYGKQIGVFIENTQKVIPEFLVDLDLLIEKAAQYNLELVETNTFEKDFNDILTTIKAKNGDLSLLEKDILELDKDSVQKKFSFFNRYIIMKKIN